MHVSEIISVYPAVTGAVDHSEKRALRCKEGGSMGRTRVGRGARAGYSGVHGVGKAAIIDRAIYRR